MIFVHRFGLSAMLVLASTASLATSSVHRRGDRFRGESAAIIRSANSVATIGPTRAGYVSAVQVYPWIDGVVFRLVTAPGRISDIALEPGETLISVAAGDTVRWIVGDTSSGVGAEKQTHILVKPNAAGLTTNVLITTDKRSYHLELTSTALSAMAAIRWNYPAGALLSIKAPPLANDAQSGGPTKAMGGVDPTHFSFAYTISGDRPAWRPVRAFDDGRQTFVEFPAALATGEAPPLFVIGTKRDPQLVNYRVLGRYYIVDQLFDQAELRLGNKPQKIVRIKKTQVGAP